MNQPQCTLSVDRMLELLASAHRRQLLRVLAEEVDTDIEREDLARLLHARSDLELDTLEATLAHHHLPKLADEHLIEYDYRQGTVRPTALLEKLLPLLEACEDLEATFD